jgi:Carbohydrate-binding module 48 (Isoamylase N-terminal domain)
MDHVLITRRLTKLPSAAARPFVWFATLFMSGVITGLHLMSGLRRFRPGGPDQSATVTPDEAAQTQSQATATTEQAPIGLAAIGLADTELAAAEQTSAEQAAPAAEPVLTTELTCEPTIPTVPVTFTLPSEVGAGDVALCADFNNWTAGSIPLSRGGDGAWQVTVPLEPGNTYHFRYLLDGQRWENAWQADRYEPNPFGSDNSVVIVDWPEWELQAA